MKLIEKFLNQAHSCEIRIIKLKDISNLRLAIEQKLLLLQQDRRRRLIKESAEIVEIDQQPDKDKKAILKTTFESLPAINEEPDDDSVSEYNISIPNAMSLVMMTGKEMLGSGAGVTTGSKIISSKRK